MLKKITLKKVFYLLIFWGLSLNVYSFVNVNPAPNKGNWELSLGFSKMFLGKAIKPYFEEGKGYILLAKTPYFWQIGKNHFRPFVSLSKKTLSKKTSDIKNSSDLFKFGLGLDFKVSSLLSSLFLSASSSLNYYMWKATANQMNFGRKRLITSSMLGAQLALSLTYYLFDTLSFNLQISQDFASFNIDNNYRTLSFRLGWMI